MHYDVLAQGMKHFKEKEKGFWMSGGHPEPTEETQ